MDDPEVDRSRSGRVKCIGWVRVLSSYETKLVQLRADISKKPQDIRLQIRGDVFRQVEALKGIMNTDRRVGTGHERTRLCASKTCERARTGE